MQCKNCYGTVAEFLAAKDAKITELTATNAKLEADYNKLILDYNQLQIMFKVACDALQKQGIKITVEGKPIAEFQMLKAIGKV